MTPFMKMHGLGNDFVVFDARKEPISLDSRAARAISDRRLGIGCDQVIVIENGANGADAFMRIYNADGDEVESCGNAARCVARLLMDERGRGELRLDAEGAPLVCHDTDGLVTIDMGAPVFDWRRIPLRNEVNTDSFALALPQSDRAALKSVSALSMGNPHCVLFIDEISDDAVHSLGRAIEHHPMFPQRTNVEFVDVPSPDRLRMRVWERGAGVTLACGTGACAAAVAAQRRGLCGTKVAVELEGGTLTIEWDGTPDAHVFMTGPTALSFRGEIDLETLR